MRREVHEHGNRFVGQIVETHHRQFTVNRLRLDFRVAVAIEAVEFDRTRRYLRGSEFGMRFSNGSHNSLLHLSVVAKRRVKLPFAFALLIRQFEHRPVMRMRTGDEGILDFGIGFNSSPNVLQRSFGGRPAEVQANDGEFIPLCLDDQRRGVKRVEGARGECVVSCAVAPHRRRLFRRDVAFGGSNLEAGSGRFGRRNDGNGEKNRNQRPVATRGFHRARLMQAKRIAKPVSPL